MLLSLNSPLSTWGFQSLVPTVILEAITIRRQILGRLVMRTHLDKGFYLDCEKRFRGHCVWIEFLAKCSS